MTSVWSDSDRPDTLLPPSAVFAALAFLAFTAVYLLIKKQLWVIIVAHASYDTLVFPQRFFDR